MTWLKLNTWKDEKQKNFAALTPDGEHLRVCPVCNQVGLFTQNSRRGNQMWIHVEEREGGMVLMTDFCEMKRDGRIYSYVGGVKVSYDAYDGGSHEDNEE